MNNHVSDSFVFELWLIPFIIYGDTPGLPPSKEKIVQNWPNFDERCALIYNDFLVQEVFLYD